MWPAPARGRPAESEAPKGRIMAKRGHYSFEKRQKELKRAEKKRKKLERRQAKNPDEADGVESGEAEVSAEDAAEGDGPQDEADPALADPGSAA